MNPQHPELFPQRPIRSDFGRAPSYRTRRITTIVIILLLVGGIVHWVFGGSSMLHSGEIPTIKAEGSWKQKPEQPGGLDIPHQDVQVYQALDGNAAKPQVEHLLPPPEVPQVASPVPATESNVTNNSTPAPAGTAPQAEKLMPKTESTDEVLAPVTPPVVATTVESQPVKPPAAPTLVKPVPPTAAQPVKSKPVTAAKLPKEAATGNEERVVQLASVQDEGSANDMMNKLQSRYASTLGDTQLHLVKADLGEKGIYYRIQSQPVSDEQANRICAVLKKMKAGCLLVR